MLLLDVKQNFWEMDVKASEFVKKFGWDVAIKLSNEMTGITQDVADCVACWGQSEWDYLKRLVKSHELVEEYGGLDKAKEQAERFKLNTCIKMYGFMCQIITDVESCQ